MKTHVRTHERHALLKHIQLKHDEKKERKYVFRDFKVTRMDSPNQGASTEPIDYAYGTSRNDAWKNLEKRWARLRLKIVRT